MKITRRKQLFFGIIGGVIIIPITVSAINIIGKPLNSSAATCIQRGASAYVCDIANGNYYGCSESYSDDAMVEVECSYLGNRNDSSSSGSGSGSDSDTTGANPTNSIVKYNKNTTDTVSNMPTVSYCDNTYEMCSFTVASDIPTRTGYTFKGWSTSTNGTVIQPGGFAWEAFSYSSSDQKYVVNLYAIWQQNSGSGTSGGSSSTGDSSDSSSTGGSSTSGGSSSTGSSDETSSEDETGSTDTANDGYESKEEKYTIDSTFQYLEDDELFVVTFSGDANEIEAIYVDGEAVPEDKYEVLSESSVGINVAYLTAYGKGQHEFVIEWADGVAKTTLLINSDGTIDGVEDDALAVPNTSSLTPDTGSNTNEDNGSVMVLAGVIPAIILIALLAVMNKQKTHRKFD